MLYNETMQFITSYNPEWPDRFQKIATFLGAFLPGECVIHHVGSTSVPGMPAKDIIDLDIEFPQGELPKVIERLKVAGYEHEGNLGIDGREAFTCHRGSRASHLPTHHLYACETGAHELCKHLNFREYLKAHPHRSQWLAQQKKSADAAGATREEYIRNKTPAYHTVTQESLEWAKSRDLEAV